MSDRAFVSPQKGSPSANKAVHPCFYQWLRARLCRNHHCLHYRAAQRMRVSPTVRRTRFRRGSRSGLCVCVTREGASSHMSPACLFGPNKAGFFRCWPRLLLRVVSEGRRKTPERTTGIGMVKHGKKRTDRKRKGQHLGP